MNMAMAETPNRAALYRLMAWLSPAYPTGAYSYSHGIEWAVEAGRITDRDSLRGWIAAILSRGTGRVDGALLAAAHRAVSAEDAAGLDDICDFSAAFRSSAETALETLAQGSAFLAVTRETWPHPVIDRLAARAENGVGVAHPVAVGAACAGHGLALDESVAAYLQAFAANLISAGMRLVPLGQTDGQRVIAVLEPVVAEATSRALKTPLEDLGTAVPMVDLSTMHHEPQRTRLFRS